MSEPTDGPWDPATEHDDKVLGDDPPTMPATLAETVRARASRPPGPARAKTPSRSAPNIHADITREQPILPKATIEDVVLLDMVSRNAPTTHAPERTATAAGSIVVVATGADAERVRRLCQAAPLDVPIVASLAVVHDAASVIVIGEPSPPAPSRVVHIARPTLSDDMLLALMRAFTTSRAVADPPSPPAPTAAQGSRVGELADRLAAETDHAAIERIGVEAILAITGADRAQLLFHDPLGGALWSEAAQRASGDARRAVAGIVGWCAHTGHPAMASPAGDDPRYLLELDDPDGKPQARLLVQPVIGGDRRVHAVLVAGRRWRRTDFTEAERASLRDFAALIAPALDTAALTGPRRATRSTLPGVATSLAAAGAANAAPAELSPATTMELPQQGELRPPSSPSTPPTEPGQPSPAHTMHMASQAELRPPAMQHSVAASEPSPAHTMHMASQAELRPPAMQHSLEGRAPSPAGTMQMPRQSELRPPSRAPTEPGQSSPVAASATRPAATAQTSPTKLPPSESAQTKRAPIDDSSAKRAATAEPRAKRASAEESTRSASDSRRDGKRDSRDGIEPRDIAVIATDPVDIARVGKLARKARLEVSVLSSTDEVPAYYRIVTIGEAWTPDSDARVVYAARIEITDDQLSELLSGIASERAPAPLVAYKPATIVEARRLQPAFASLRTIASDGDLALAETTAVSAIKQLLDADRAYCLYFDASDGSLWSETRERTTNDDRRAIAGVVGWAARTGRAVNVERASADPRWLGPLDDPDGDPNSQLLIQPLVTADRRVIGVLVAVRRPKRPGFTDADVSLLAQLAALATPLFEQLELADDCAQQLRDTSAPVEVPVAPSPIARLVAGANTLPRWSYAVAGAAVTAALMLLARC